MILTAEHLKLGRSVKRSWNARQLRLLDVTFWQGDWPRTVTALMQSVGKDYDPDVIEEFIALRDCHLVDTTDDLTEQFFFATDGI